MTPVQRASWFAAGVFAAAAVLGALVTWLWCAIGAAVPWGVTLGLAAAAGAYGCWLIHTWDQRDPHARRRDGDR